MNVIKSDFTAEEKEVFKRVSELFLTRFKQYIINVFRVKSTHDQLVHVSHIISQYPFARQIFDACQRYCFIYTNSSWQSKVMDTLDLETIYRNAEDLQRDSGEIHQLEYQDFLVKELLRYFKQDFFHWCDKPDCAGCGTNEYQEFKANIEPNKEEEKYQCSVVELFKCSKCGSLTRFPRYNDPTKLLETRTGRCGEWNNLFCLILNSFGLETRYVINSEDHVWCEYYSPYHRKWTHLDSCEQAFDQPLLYSENWNKKMSYCIAYGRYIVEDVSGKYISQNQLPRNKIPEADLTFLCQMTTRKLRMGCTDDELYKLYCMDEQDKFCAFRVKIPKYKFDHYMGRISGSPQWRAARGENGK